MKFSLTLVFCFLSVCCDAQRCGLEKVDFTRDSIQFEGKIAHIKRYSQAQLSRKSNGACAATALGIIHFQNLIGGAPMFVSQGREITFLDAAQHLLSSLERNSPEFDARDFDAEMRFYEWYNLRLLENGRTKQALADSISAVALAAKKTEALILAVEGVANRRKEDSIADVVVAHDEREWLTKCIKKFGKSAGTRIANGQVWLGISKEMCLYAWGNAESISKTRSNGVIIETWIYSNFRRFLIFKNGRLASITR